MFTTITRGLTVLAVAATLAACDPVDDPNPQPDHRPAPAVAEKKITMHWYSTQPYRAKWKITTRNGKIANAIQAQNPDGYDLGKGELIAGGAFDHTVTVGPTELIFTLTVIMGSRDATGWVKVTEGEGPNGKELAYEAADRGTRQGTTNYHYQP